MRTGKADRNINDSCPLFCVQGRCRRRCSHVSCFCPSLARGMKTGSQPGRCGWGPAGRGAMADHQSRVQVSAVRTTGLLLEGLTIAGHPGPRGSSRPERVHQHAGDQDHYPVQPGPARRQEGESCGTEPSSDERLVGLDGSGLATWLNLNRVAEIDSYKLPVDFPRTLREFQPDLWRPLGVLLHRYCISKSLYL